LKIKAGVAQELTQVSEDEVRKSFANLIKYGLIELSGKDGVIRLANGDRYVQYVLR
jgi:vacuolar-type H+-ATPase subunit E/Vma4